MDSFGRTIDYLRISVTDRCNERCLYCMPNGYKGWGKKADYLSATEILKVIQAACSLGFHKFRLTGGEPLLRHDIDEIASGISKTPGVQTLAISTNGIQLLKKVHSLKESGVNSLNISLDALNPELYRNITGGNVSDVLAGIDAALGAHFESVKLNCVLMRGVNEGEIWPLVQFAALKDIPLRFIELMPISKSDVLEYSRFLSVPQAMHLISQHDKLERIPAYKPGNGPARYYQLKKTKARIGFIGAISTPDFCESCNKLRVTADGKIRPCLGQHREIDLLPTLRTDGNVEELIREAIRSKPENHQFADCYEPGRPMTALGG
jgi:cyclic pyranopterin phosphate synthase